MSSRAYYILYSCIAVEYEGKLYSLHPRPVFANNKVDRQASLPLLPYMCHRSHTLLLRMCPYTHTLPLNMSSYSNEKKKVSIAKPPSSKQGNSEVSSATCVFSYYYIYYICVSSRLHMCPHTTTHVSSYCLSKQRKSEVCLEVCVLVLVSMHIHICICVCVSSYYYACVRIFELAR